MPIKKLYETISQYNAARYVYACLDAANRYIGNNVVREIMDIIYQPGFEDEYCHFGLSNEERHSWPNDPIEIIKGGKTREIMDALLSDAERKKIEINNAFMAGV